AGGVRRGHRLLHGDRAGRQDRLHRQLEAQPAAAGQQPRAPPLPHPDRGPGGGRRHFLVGGPDPLRAVPAARPRAREPGPGVAWHVGWWPILGYVCFEFATNVVAIVRPGWVATNLGLRALRDLAGCGIVVGLLQAGHWLDATGPWPDSEQPFIAANFDKGMQI